MGRQIVLAMLSVCHSVRPSICLSRFCFHSISFCSLLGFTFNLAQMLSMIRRCAVLRVRMFQQGRFKVKVVFKG